jgi:hypothetical protein
LSCPFIKGSDHSLARPLCPAGRHTVAAQFGISRFRRLGYCSVNHRNFASRELSDPNASHSVGLGYCWARVGSSDAKSGCVNVRLWLIADSLGPCLEQPLNPR